MEQVYLTEITIKQIRHLQNIKIELSKNEKKHLLLTGTNGCGKTSVLKAIGSSLFQGKSFAGNDWYEVAFNSSSKMIEKKSNLPDDTDGKNMYKLYQEGQIILANFSADRRLVMNKTKAVERVDITKIKSISENMNVSFEQLLVYMYVEKLFAKERGEIEGIRDTEN